MTKFVGESKATRAGRSAKSSAISGKERQKHLQKFMETGLHPLLEYTKELNTSAALAPLPTLDINRPHVFMDLQLGNRALGRIVIELFEDLAPVAASAFRTRCLEGHHTLKGSCIHKLQPRFAAFGGKAPGAVDARIKHQGPRLQHSDAGLLSIAADGEHFALTLGRALQLDSAYHIIGRVGLGTDVLEKLSDVVTGPDDEPEPALRVVQCGVTDHKGSFETLSVVNAAPATAAEAASNAQRDLRGARASVASALQQGLQRAQGAERSRPAKKASMPVADMDSGSDGSSSSGDD